MLVDQSVAGNQNLDENHGNTSSNCSILQRMCSFGVKLALMSNKNWVGNIGISGLVKYDQLDLPPPSKDATVTTRSDGLHF